MTKFQFHVLITLGLWIATFHLKDFDYYFVLFFVLVFFVFAVIDAVKVAQSEILKNKNN